MSMDQAVAAGAAWQPEERFIDRSAYASTIVQSEAAETDASRGDPKPSVYHLDIQNLMTEDLLGENSVTKDQCGATVMVQFTVPTGTRF